MSARKASSSPTRSSRLSAQFHELLEIHDPRQMSRQLRNMFLDYLSRHVDMGLPPDFGTWVWQLGDLLSLLDAAADERQLVEKKRIKQPS